MLNRSADSLTILIGTHNRLPLLKKSIDSIVRGTSLAHEIFVIDAGSTDGTIEYLETRRHVTPVLQGERLGASRAYNRVWRQIDSRWTVWLSDDTELAPGALDRAVNILECDDTIGMVGLKMRDTVGPYKSDPYMGGISEYGILNCNHGVLSMGLLRAVGFFNEAYRSYMIDPDLTASVLAAGRKVVMSRDVSVWHHREWSLRDGKAIDRQAFAEMQRQAAGGIDNAAVYRKKFEFLKNSRTGAVRARKALIGAATSTLYRGTPFDKLRFGLNQRDWYNLSGARFVSLADPFETRDRDYHLVQRIPQKFLLSDQNPYRGLVRGGARPIAAPSPEATCAN